MVEVEVVVEVVVVVVVVVLVEVVLVVAGCRISSGRSISGDGVS